MAPSCPSVPLVEHGGGEPAEEGGHEDEDGGGDEQLAVPHDGPGDEAQQGEGVAEQEPGPDDRGTLVRGPHGVLATQQHPG